MYIGALWLDSQPSVIILSHPVRRLHSWCWYTQNPRLWVHLLAALGPLAESRRSKPNKGGLFCSNQRLSLQNEPGAEPGRSFAVGNMLLAGRPAGPAHAASSSSQRTVCGLPTERRGWGATIVFLSLLHKKKKSLHTNLQVFLAVRFGVVEQRLLGVLLLVSIAALIYRLAGADPNK